MRKSFRQQERLSAFAIAERDAATATSAAKSTFLASMSHELRTPLNAVIGYSEMLREGAEEDGRKGDITDHDRVIGAARRLLTLIDDLLDLSKAEAGKVVLKPCEFDVRGLVDATPVTIAPAAASRGNRTRLDVADDIGSGATDEFRLGQCLLNLLSNAAKFTRDGEISMSAWRETRADGDWLVFEIGDRGIGMSPIQLRDLFQPFMQIEAAVSQAHGGTGLGLAITRQLAHRARRRCRCPQHTG
jgi:signal transduction histidine kinase